MSSHLQERFSNHEYIYVNPNDYPSDADLFGDDPTELYNEKRQDKDSPKRGSSASPSASSKRKTEPGSFLKQPGTTAVAIKNSPVVGMTKSSR